MLAGHLALTVAALFTGAAFYVGFLLSTIQWWQSGDGLWLVGALLLLANWPFTLIVIMPTNNALLATPSEAASAGSRELVVKWGRLHAVRTALGAAATLVFLWAVS